MSRTTKVVLVGVGVILAVLIASSFALGAGGGWHSGGWGMMGPWMMGGFGWGWFMALPMILFWGLIVWLVVALVRGTAAFGSSDSGLERADSAMEVLKRRYARGEISKEEYEEKKEDLA